MNILLINHYAGSTQHGMEYRPFYMARAWNRLGHRTRVVASSFSHLRAAQPEPSTVPRHEMLDGVEYCWLPGGEYHGNGVGRIRNMLAFLSGLYRHERFVTAEFRPDAVVSSSTYPLDAFPAHRIARRYGARFVHEVHDLWPLSPMELGNMSRWHPFIATMQVAEDFAYRRADRVVSMLPRAEAHMRAHGLAPGKFVYVANGIDVAEWEASDQPLPTEAASALQAFRRRCPFLIGYAGAHGVANALEVLVEAAARVVQTPVGFVLVGHGPEKEALRARAARLGLENLIFLDPVKKRTIPALLAAMDALFIGWHRSPLYRFGVSPNKLMDYMMAAKPVLHAIEAGNDLVAEARCGISVAPEDPGAIADGVHRLMATSAGERAEMGARGRKFILEHHTYDVLSRRFLAALGG
ncbi:glycosyltransferase family 4 protein [Anaeromyxobacter soli]|uniref:glycosyltransferase family 4 protein n=1 Tax=Anaeromyxobacter soli TaxID=2922725 RepID=UPI001FAFAB85|nr:glycosyltransferase family 4 protein [Anaeromyxobacter sp. SG29]